MKTICISEKTHKILGNIGKKRETYEEIIIRLVEYYEHEKYEI